eukprot:2295018-Rhodomonas_salina.1
MAWAYDLNPVASSHRYLCPCMSIAIYPYAYRYTCSSTDARVWCYQPQGLGDARTVSYTHLRAHETEADL